MSKNIKCTKCGTDIDLKDALYEELKSDFNSNLEIEVENKTKDLHKQISTLTTMMQKYMSEAGEARAKVTELSFQIKDSDNITELKINERLEQEREKIDITIQQEVANKSVKINESAALKVQEKLDVIEQLKKQLEIATQKATQGSMQTQGEAQEVLIEEYLKSEFPLDNISEVKKGVAGCDCIQTVNTRTNNNVGIIYYEVKNTKNYNKEWLSKFKKDILNNRIGTGILVSKARPINVTKATIIDGIWVCTFQEFKIISTLVRDTICKVYDASKSQDNSKEKMKILYDYLISNDFKLQVDNIINSFSTMQNDLTSEQRAVKSLWKKRQVQIDNVIDSVISMHSTIKAVGGADVLEIPSLKIN